MKSHGIYDGFRPTCRDSEKNLNTRTVLDRYQCDDPQFRSAVWAYFVHLFIQIGNSQSTCNTKCSFRNSSITRKDGHIKWGVLIGQFSANHFCFSRLSISISFFIFVDEQKNKMWQADQETPLYSDEDFIRGKWLLLHDSYAWVK